MRGGSWWQRRAFCLQSTTVQQAQSSPGRRGVPRAWALSLLPSRCRSTRTLPTSLCGTEASPKHSRAPARLPVAPQHIYAALHTVYLPYFARCVGAEHSPLDGRPRGAPIHHLRLNLAAFLQVLCERSALTNLSRGAAGFCWQAVPCSRSVAQPSSRYPNREVRVSRAKLQCWHSWGQKRGSTRTEPASKGHQTRCQRTATARRAASRQGVRRERAPGSGWGSSPRPSNAAEAPPGQKAAPSASHSPAPVSPSLSPGGTAATAPPRTP